MNKVEREIFLRQKFQEMRKWEDALYARGARYIAGVDEVGRGPLAGPVVAAAVALPADFFLPGLDDSKKLSEKKRDAFFDVIAAAAVAHGIGVVDHETIDEINILEATKKAMKAAVEEASGRLRRKNGAALDHALVDALTIEGIDIPRTAIIKGDERSVSIAAASILAKVTRDRMMVQYHAAYPFYGFDKNKGYGTKAHYEGIAKHGICPIHRRSFVRGK